MHHDIALNLKKICSVQLELFVSTVVSFNKITRENSYQHPTTFFPMILSYHTFILSRLTENFPDD